MANELKHATVGTSLTQAEFEDVLLHILNSQAIGDIIYASSATQLSRLGIGSTGQLLSVSGGIPAWGSKAAGDIYVVLKSADETVNNSETLQNDDALLQAIVASEVWLIECLILYNTSAVADIKFTFTVPSGASGAWWTTGAIGEATHYLNLQHTVALATAQRIDGTGAAAYVTLHALVINSTNAGNIQLQFAQNTAEVSDTKVLAKSSLIAMKLG